MAIGTQADPKRHPRLFLWQKQRPSPDFLPDAVVDTTAKRRRKARGLFGDGTGILCRLLACKGRSLFHAVVALPEACHLYWEAPALVRQELVELFGDAPHYVKLALSRTGRVHAHVVVALTESERLCLPARGTWGELYCEPVQSDQHLQALASYLGRPNLEGACRPKQTEWGRYSQAQLRRQQQDAAEFYLAARAEARSRGLEQLPRLVWSKNLPFLKPDPPAWRVLLQLIRQRPRPCPWPVPEVEVQGHPVALKHEANRVSVTPCARGPPEERGKQFDTAAAVPTSCEG